MAVRGLLPRWTCRAGSHGNHQGRSAGLAYTQRFRMHSANALSLSLKCQSQDAQDM